MKLPPADRRPVDPDGRPREPSPQPGYYPGFRTLSQAGFWDEATRRQVLERVGRVPPIEYFTAEEAALLESVVSHLLPQDDRVPESRIPIVPWIDRRLAEGRTPGYRFTDMPPDGNAYQLGLQAIDAMARQVHGKPFRELAWGTQDLLLKSVHDGEPRPGAEHIWAQLPLHRFWALMVQDCIEAYYAHPWAWDEIGFGGPAYPRGYVRLERGDPEPWEKPERRHEWKAPPDAVSDPSGSDVATHRDHPAAGQGGTH